MIEFERARGQMVDNQLRTSAVTDWRLLAQMGTVPRELFVPEGRRSVAYIDDVQWLGGRAAGRFMAAPAIFAKLLQLAEITEADSVLDIGAATGYSSAVIAGLAAAVVSLEQEADLAAIARANLAQLGITNARVVNGDIAAVAGEQFDVIMVEGALDSVPASFLAALKDGGRLVALIRNGGVGVANVFVKTGTGTAARGEFNATLPPLYAAQSAEEFVF